MRSVSVGFWVGIGGRHESLAECGLSHFVEHLLFKGTKHRSARQLTEDVEGLGGYLNAFTTEDHTCYYARAGAPHLAKLCDVLSDMFLHSEFAPAEIEREREVIREEILSYRDAPEQHASDLLTEAMWPKHPLGQPLTGTVETISRFKRPQIKQFVREHYNASNVIVAVAGPVKHEDVEATLAKALSKLPEGRRPKYSRARALKPGPVQIKTLTQDTEQMHLAMGYHAVGRRDERRYALRLLSIILGENMSSRLFQSLRERRGYCYSVQTNVVTLDDTGAIHICAGLDAKKLRASLKLIRSELERICTKAISKHELKKAQDYAVGQTFMGLESTTNQMMWIGESLLGYGRIPDPADIERHVLAVTPRAVQEVACHCLHEGRLGVAVVGPVAEKDVRSWVAG